ncbi:hypothetical protein ACGFZQ_35385 [Streptomyces sp. NPDC048254]|uniref:hypothetical protein n=1 Tax=Streptomyces sp. NPDC048254 TaxID=3365525 RepID=UPI0037137B48
MKRTERLLNELESLVSDHADCHEPDCREPDGPPASECHAASAAGDAADAECLRCAIADLLRRHRPRPRDQARDPAT